MLEEVTINKPDFLSEGNWEIENLNRINILFGKNGSGKSLLLRNLRDQNREYARYIVPERAGNITSRPNLLQNLRTPEQREQQANNNFQNNYREFVVTRIDNYFRVKGFHADREEKFANAELEGLLNTLLSDFVFEFQDGNQPYTLHRDHNGNKQAVNNINQLSSGETQLFTLGLDILMTAAEWELANSEQRLLLIDEPDAHIHPDLQAKFADFLVQVSNRFDVQVFIATHSTVLLSTIGAYAPDSTNVIYLSKKTENISAERFDELKTKITACLGGHSLVGALFDIPILLVEGDDDYRIWSQVGRYDTIDLSVIPCQGEQIFNYQKHLEKLFSALLETPETPIGYALLDNDKALPEPNPDNPQDYIKFIQLSCHEAENLFLSDEVLNDIGINWDKACERITENASNHGAKEQLLVNPQDWNRKNHDLKPIIKEAEKAIDNKNVLWSQRVGQVIGKEKPEGQLANFLGGQVLNSLWN
ncbi:ATP-dependent nuclease [Fodinibius salsisoli]|uniref:AAA family ATPase n=1 Tax=Fodinibius salsisoli TaxID=2820877 RepID=A0ABT3PTL2_9BACT|nr:AAA family ATPase [Fodinibius salsisoli]MCW9709209.1 AAA family ATPase [Fodinibius salsisoli]